MATKEISEEQQKIIEKLQAQYGAVAPFIVRGTFVVVRMANPGDLHRYKETLGRAMSPKGRRERETVSIADAERTLALSCIVVPEDKAAKLALFDAQPGLIGRAASRAEQLAEDEIEDLEGN